MPPLHRHQLSLEGVLDFSSTEGLSTIQRADARRRFYRIVNHFLPASEIDSSARSQTYSPPRLISLTYKYALSNEARDNFLRAFFQSIDIPIVEDRTGDDDDDPETLRPSVFAFADYLMDQFFLPLKASTKKTPQPSPVFHSAVERVQGGPQTFAGTPDRLSALRGACLVRDHHRCVISYSFDSSEAQARMDKAGETQALDNDGNLLYRDPNRPGSLEVAYIISYFLIKVDANSELSPSKKAALAILNMFDTGVVYLIKGGDIDRLRNAFTFTQLFHVHFGEFKIFFAPVPDLQPYIYRIDSFLSRYILPEFSLIRTFYLSENRTIDPPSARLLALHCAIAYILYLSAAGEYIDKLLREMEGQGVCAADGSTELDRLLRLGLRGWSVST
ncbi:hypothetical protein F5Y16DRAFT_393245 [Xylariaceae sp. FL0255]|nr:hypothetical protein F5Y16DRAFT_393245 [Xylariaceae sp. FL0255]